MKYSGKIFKNRMFIISAAAVTAIAAIIITVIAVVRSPKKSPVPGEYITVTVEADNCAFFRLDPADYSVTKADVLNKHDADLVADTAGLIPFSQASNIYIKNLIKAQKLSLSEDGVVLFAVESINEKDFDALSAQFKSVLKENGSKAGVYALYIKVKSSDIQALADEAGCSYAKAYLCSKIANQSGKLKAKELINKSIPEIINALVAAKPEIKDDVDKVIDEIIKESNDEQANTSIPGSSDTSSETSSDASSGSSQTPGDTPSTPSDTSSDNSSSDNSSSGGSSSGFVVSKDEDGWLPGIY